MIDRSNWFVGFSSMIAWEWECDDVGGIRGEHDAKLPQWKPDLHAMNVSQVDDISPVSERRIGNIENSTFIVRLTLSTLFFFYYCNYVFIQENIFFSSSPFLIIIISVFSSLSHRRREQSEIEEKSGGIFFIMFHTSSLSPNLFCVYPIPELATGLLRLWFSALGTHVRPWRDANVSRWFFIDSKPATVSRRDEMLKKTVECVFGIRKKTVIITGPNRTIA